MAASADSALFSEFDAKGNITVKLCRSILKVIPFAPNLVWYNTLDGAFKAAAEGREGRSQLRIFCEQYLLS